jgi:hypothetical protein
VATSETPTEQARQRIENAFGVPVLDNYASGECLFLSNGCHTDPGAHVNADWAILEVVDEANRPIPAGQPGHKILLTHLANTVQPFIRYEIADRVVMGTSPCRCGNRLPRVERVDGRSADFFWVRDGSGYRPLSPIPSSMLLSTCAKCASGKPSSKGETAFWFGSSCSPVPRSTRRRPEPNWTNASKPSACSARSRSSW